MSESAAGVSVNDFVLKHTTVSKPQVEHGSSAQSDTAAEDYQSSLSTANTDDDNGNNNSRPVSAASDARLFDHSEQARNYSTPPSSPSMSQPLAEPEVQPGTAAGTHSASTMPPSPPPISPERMRARQQTGPSGTSPIRRKPIGSNSPDTSSEEEGARRVSYPPPQTSVARSTPSPDADDAPYIRFALDQLTRDEEVRGSRRYPTHDRWSTAPTYGAPGLESSRPTRTVAPSPALYSPYPPVSRYRDYQVPAANRPKGNSFYDPMVLAAATGGAAGAAAGVGAAVAAGTAAGTTTSPPSSAPRPVNTRGTDGTAEEQLPRQTSAGQMSAASTYQTPPQEPTLPVLQTRTQVPPQTQIHPLANQPTNTSLLTQPDVFVPYDQDVPSLRFLPGILRPFSLGIFIFLCLLMLAGLIFCGVWSRTHNGLWAYTTFGGSRYFVFQYLPTICGVILLLWLFQVQIAVQRVAPFIAMSSYDTVSRSEAPLMEMQPTNFLLPKLFYFRARQPIIGLAMIIFWLQIFTVPLLTCLFNAFFHTHTMDSGWTWTTVQGIVWTLVALYGLLVIALLVLAPWLWAQRTGLKWDPRSISDLISLLDRSNIIRDYEGSESFVSARDFRTRLEVRSDRLGYWTSSRKPNDVFYGLGEEGGTTRRYSIQGGKLREKSPPEGVSGFYPDTPTTPGRIVDLEDTEEFEQARYRYIPWYLRTTFVVLWILAGIILYIAFLVVSFVNEATINGFRPLLPVEATASGFSATNFLYSFIPALIAQIIFLCWLSVDYAFRRLQPYSAMSNITNPGAEAIDSLLLDYPARLPFSVTISALVARNAHVAWFSFLSLIAACFPIMAGGCFWAQWYIPTREVRVAVHPSAFYALCVFLAIFAFSLPLILIGLRQRRLPHGVTTLAEQISFLYGSHILGEREWRAPLGSKTEMTGRLMAAATPQERQRGHGQFLFGRFVGRDGRTHIGIDRVGREGGTRSWRMQEARKEIPPPPPVAKPPPRFRRSPSGRLIPAEPPATETSGTRFPYDEEREVETPRGPPSVRQIVPGEGFPTLPLAGAAVAGAGAVAAGAAAYHYDYGSKQNLLTESEKADYVRRKEGGTFGSPPMATGFDTTSTAPVASSSAAPVLIPAAAMTQDDEDSVSPIDEDDDDYIDTRPTTKSYDYGSQEQLLGESDKAEFVRRREGGSFRSRPTSGAYETPISAREAALGAGAAAGIGIATSTAEDTAVPAATAGPPQSTLARTPSGRASASAAVQRQVSQRSQQPPPPLPTQMPSATTQTAATATAIPPVPPQPETRTRARTGSSSNLPNVPPTAAQVYPYGSAYGSMRDLTASEQAEYIRRRDGGPFNAPPPTSQAAPSTVPRPVVGPGGQDVGQDLGGGLREASAGQWSRNVLDEFDRNEAAS